MIQLKKTIMISIFHLYLHNPKYPNENLWLSKIKDIVHEIPSVDLDGFYYDVLDCVNPNRNSKTLNKFLESKECTNFMKQVEKEIILSNTSDNKKNSVNSEKLLKNINEINPSTGVDCTIRKHSVTKSIMVNTYANKRNSHQTNINLDFEKQLWDNFTPKIPYLEFKFEHIVREQNEMKDNKTFYFDEDILELPVWGQVLIFIIIYAL